MPSTLSATSLLLLLICYVTLSLTTVEAFSTSCATTRISTSTTFSKNTGMLTTGFRRFMSSSSSDDEDPDTPTTKLSLEEKMAQWEATDEEKKAATLGGLIPEPVGGSGKSSGPEEPGSVERSDAFDVGLYIAFPIMVLSGLFFALFPFIMGSIDVDSVGPPPTI
eukprot:CAMPEP_0113466590 /NCGR_PEP_ID=MMETSP0014_2-20120614/14354_1 /TAXON_ID=2857 /ORGANISM="Nitzschia sp." /LENGTH=164 /DNA_ID=CAMNT_0000358825 /DNA_START=173 /DNA_END=667 /DNA_ORIENTATION=+ /assembly_acc=CAM_ASM_000159